MTRSIQLFLNNLKPRFNKSYARATVCHEFMSRAYFFLLQLGELLYKQQSSTFCKNGYDRARVTAKCEFVNVFVING